MPTGIIQKRSIYPVSLPAVEEFKVYPLEMIRPRYMPAADMRSILNNYHHRPAGGALAELPHLSVSKSTYLPFPSTTRPASSKRPPRFTARGTAVPENKMSANYAERLLPRAPRIKTDTIPNGGPYMFLNRKRKLYRPLDNGIYNYSEPPSPAWSPVGTPRDICSVTGRPYSRKRWVLGPRDNLVVASFDGGASDPTPNEVRFLQLMRGTTMVI